MEDVKEPQVTESQDVESVESMESLSSEELEVEEPQQGQLLDGTVLEVRDEGLVVDISAKRDGFVPRADLKNLNEEERAKFTTVDQEIPVLVTQPETADGNVELSISRALEQKDWEKARRFKEEKTVYETEVVGANRGGLLVNFEHLQGFVPMSQLIGFSRIRNPEKRYQRLQEMVGETLLLKAIEVNQERNRLILSQRAAAKEWRARRREQLLEELEPGQVRSGRISQITDFGLFVNLGGIDGLVHVSELSWGRIENPEEEFKVGQRLKVKVLNVDRERQRIGLSLKALQPDPWESVAEKYREGDLVQGTVSQVVDFGVFVELEPGIEGLLHNSELLSPGQREELQSGDEILVKIIRVEPHRRRIGLSAKQVQLHEWEAWHAEHSETVTTSAEEAEVEETETVEAEAAEAEETVTEEPAAEVTGIEEGVEDEAEAPLEDETQTPA
ncbi:MAG: 30S ribosomal protein S1 [Anaerolineae bacterium]